MSWVVPENCCYAVWTTAWNYYYSDDIVPDNVAPNKNLSSYSPDIFILVDFENGYIYNNLNIGSMSESEYVTLYGNKIIHNTKQFRVSPISSYLIIPGFNVSVIGSEEALSNKHIILDNHFRGIFTFGDGTGLFDKEDFLRDEYSQYTWETDPETGMQYLEEDLTTYRYYLSNTFSNRTDITSATIPNGVEGLYCTFEGCTSLETVSGSLTHAINFNHTFYGCTDLTTVPTFPNSIENYEYKLSDFTSCFAGCSSLVNSPVIPYGVKIMDWCFDGCTSLVSPPIIPNTVGYVEEDEYDEDTEEIIYEGESFGINGCFNGCTSLTSAPAISSNIPTMTYTFRNCTSLVSAPNMSNATSVTNMEGCFDGCTSLETAPVIPYSVTDIRFCFRNCTSLMSVPDLSYATNLTYMQSCFNGCTSLSGNIVVNNNPTAYSSIFNGTLNNIYIIDGGSAGTVWENTIVPVYSNVHYEADDNSLSSLSMSVIRVDSVNSEVQTANGEYAFVRATLILTEDNMPVGWSKSIGNKVLTKNSVSISPTWTTTNTGNVYTLKCWVALEDLGKQLFSLQISDIIKDDENRPISTRLTNLVTYTLSNIYKLVDYYHEADPLDPNYDKEGMAIGKFAEHANLFDVAMPSEFGESLIKPDMSAQDIQTLVNNLAYSGLLITDYVVEQGTSGIWTYRKWNSGILECWGSHTGTSKAGTQWVTNLFYSDESVTFPSNLFISTPNQITATANQSQWIVYACCDITATGFTMRYTKPNNVSQIPSSDIYILGRWKS